MLLGEKHPEVYNDQKLEIFGLEEILVFASPAFILLTLGNCTLIFLWEGPPLPFSVHVV